MSRTRYIGLYWPLSQCCLDPLRFCVFFEITRMVCNHTLTKILK